MESLFNKTPPINARNLGHLKKQIVVCIVYTVLFMVLMMKVQTTILGIFDIFSDLTHWCISCRKHMTLTDMTVLVQEY